MKNKKLFFGSITAACLTLIVGLVLLFVGMFLTEKVKYTGAEDVYMYIRFVGDSLYRTDHEGFNFDEEYSIFTKGDREEDLEEFANDVFESFEYGYNIFYNGDANGHMPTPNLNNNELDHVYISTEKYGDEYPETYEFLYFAGSEEATPVIDALESDDSNVTLAEKDIIASDIKANILEYVNTNTNTINFTSEILEITFGSLFIVSSLIAGTVILVKALKKEENKKTSLEN